MAGVQMSRLWRGVVFAAGYIALGSSFGLAVAAPEAQESGSRLAAPGVEQRPPAAKHFGAQEPPRGGNPLWGVPINVLTATRERPLFAETRRPPPPPLKAEALPPPPPAPPPPPPEPEKPRLALVG